MTKKQLAMDRAEMQAAFAARLCKLMKDTNIPRKELASQIGVTYQSLGGYLRGHHMPQVDVAYQIASFFGVSIDYLLGKSNVCSLKYIVKEL